jgi:hypothetical protein
VRLEHWFYTVPLRLRSLFRRSQVEGELDEELRRNRHATPPAAPWMDSISAKRSAGTCGG